MDGDEALQNVGATGSVHELSDLELHCFRALAGEQLCFSHTQQLNSEPLVKWLP